MSTRDEGPEAKAAPRANGQGTDEALLAGFLAGDETCFAGIVERYRRSLVRFARCYLGGAGHLAEDVAQDALIAVYRSAASFQGRSSFRTWLFSVARNACRHHLRRREREAHREDAGGDQVLEAMPDAGADPLERLEHQDVRRLIREALDALPPPLRTAVVLRDAEELSYEQIAEVLDVPMGTVRSRLHNARVRLAARLAPLRSPKP